MSIDNMSGLADRLAEVERNPEFERAALADLASHHSLNLFVLRGKAYEQVGRVQTAQEAVAVDAKVRGFLDRNGVPYGAHSHDSVELAVTGAVESFEELRAAGAPVRPKGYIRARSEASALIATHLGPESPGALSMEDLELTQDISECDGSLIFSMAPRPGIDMAFGTQAFDLGCGDWIEVYAEYDLERRGVAPELDIAVNHADGGTDYDSLLLSAEQREELLSKMDAYSRETEGMGLEGRPALEPPRAMGPRAATTAPDREAPAR